ncbi:PrpF domain-containing protein, partial [Burkholderia sp. SIMBA_052]|uniref:PrpF domain-containing protein n=1 Tax=Burkholderia sp. SIMBA_052 TaxID=3085793 RepID=UPI00397B4B07
GALEEATTHATQGATAVRGRLRVNVDPFFSRFVLGPQLGSFIEEYPELRVELVTRDQLGDMIADGFELAVRFGHPSGTLRVGAQPSRNGDEWTVTKAIMSRSARVLMEGWVRVPLPA